MKEILRLLKKAWIKWIADDCPRMGAALSYYAVFALIPFLLLTLILGGLALQETAARDEVSHQLNMYLGYQASAALQNVLSSAKPSLTSGIVGSIVGLLTLVFAASGIMLELKAAINKIWLVKVSRRGVLQSIKTRLLSMAMVIGIGLLLLLSTMASTLITAAAKYLGPLLPLSDVVIQTLNYSVSFFIIALSFAFLYKLLPDASVQWISIWAGVLLSSVLFALGRLLIDFYIRRNGLGTLYGAGGSFIVFLFWVYYSAQIFYFGAEVIHLDFEKRIKKDGSSLS